MRLVLLIACLAMQVPALSVHADGGIRQRIRARAAHISRAIQSKWMTSKQMRAFLRAHGQRSLPAIEGNGNSKTRVSVRARKREIDKTHHLGRRRFFAYASMTGTTLGVLGAAVAIASSSIALATLAACSATFSGLRSGYFRRSLNRHELLARSALLSEFIAHHGADAVHHLARQTQAALKSLEEDDRQRLERAEAHPLRWATRRYRRRRHRSSSSILEALTAALTPRTSLTPLP